MIKNDSPDRIESVQDYLTHPVRQPDDINTLFTFMRTYFDLLLRDQHDINDMILLEPVTDKFLMSVCQFSDLSDETVFNIKGLAKETANVSLGYIGNASPFSFVAAIFRSFRRAFTLSSHEKDTKRAFYLSMRLHTKLVEIYNRFSLSHTAASHHLDLYDFYLPDLSDKQSAADMIEEAIRLIDIDDTLSRSARKRVVSHLRRAIDEIEKPKTDWSTVFGRMKEVVIVLGAVGSMVGGHCALAEARDKIEEATRVIERTSINVNYMSVAYNQLIEQNVQLVLPAAKPEEHLREQTPPAVIMPDKAEGQESQPTDSPEMQLPQC